MSVVFNLIRIFTLNVLQFCTSFVTCNHTLIALSNAITLLTSSQLVPALMSNLGGNATSGTTAHPKKKTDSVGWLSSNRH